MKVVPLTLLKTGASAKVVDLVKSGDPEDASKLSRYLTSLGFYSGQDVTLLRKTGTVLQVKPGTDNPFALDLDVASTIKISAEDGDVFESLQARQKEESFSSGIKQVLEKIKNSLKK